MLPEIFLVLVSRHATALLVTNLDDGRQDFIKLLNVLIFVVHVLEHDVE